MLITSPFSLTSPPRIINGRCAGFSWIGQTFAHCDHCSAPYWEHDYDMRLRDGRWFRKWITPAMAAACRAKYEGEW
jgi:hypothetical protein